MELQRRHSASPQNGPTPPYQFDLPANFPAGPRRAASPIRCDLGAVLPHDDQLAGQFGYRTQDGGWTARRAGAAPVPVSPLPLCVGHVVDDQVPRARLTLGDECRRMIGQRSGARVALTGALYFFADAVAARHVMAKTGTLPLTRDTGSGVARTATFRLGRAGAAGPGVTLVHAPGSSDRGVVAASSMAGSLLVEASCGGLDLIEENAQLALTFLDLTVGNLKDVGILE